jgi:hypothetical protein
MVWAPNRWYSQRELQEHDQRSAGGPDGSGTTRGGSVGAGKRATGKARAGADHRVMKSEAAYVLSFTAASRCSFARQCLLVERPGRDLLRVIEGARPRHPASGLASLNMHDQGTRSARSTCEGGSSFRPRSVMLGSPKSSIRNPAAWKVRQ